MASPTLLYTWYSRCNAPFPDVTTAANVAKSWLWMLAAHLLGNVATGTTGGTRPAGSLWTCEGSSDGVTAGLDAVNRWLTAFDATKLVQAANGVAHSWIVLKSPTAAGPIWLCIDLNSATTTIAGFTFSRTAFTGGTNLTRPTTTEGWHPLLPGTAPIATTQITYINDTTAAAQNTHFTVNANGEWVYCTSRTATGVFHTFFSMHNAVEAHTGDLAKTWTGFQTTASTGRGAGVYTSGLAAAAGFTGRRSNNTAAGASSGIIQWNFGGVVFFDTALADAVTGNWNAYPLLLASAEGVGFNGDRGRIPDLWCMGAPPVGGSFPNSGAPVQHVVGSTLVPFSVVPAL